MEAGTTNQTPHDDEGSVTVTQVQALRAARNVGIAVSLKTVQKAIVDINRSTPEDGRTQYSLSSGNAHGPSMTTAGMCVFTYRAEYNSPKIEKGLQYREIAYPPGSSQHQHHWYFYGGYYATLAMYQKGGEYWRRWWPKMRAELLRTQDKETGLWKNGSECREYGEAFGTSLALLMLPIPKRYLPIFQSGQD